MKVLVKLFEENLGDVFRGCRPVAGASRAFRPEKWRDLLSPLSISSAATHSYEVCRTVVRTWQLRIRALYFRSGFFVRWNYHPTFKRSGYGVLTVDDFTPLLGLVDCQKFGRQRQGADNSFLKHHHQDLLSSFLHSFGTCFSMDDPAKTCNVVRLILSECRPSRAS